MTSSFSISTVTPVYNGAQYLPDLIVELNNFRNYLINNSSKLRLIESIFIVDDCIDNSLEVLESQKKEHDWIKVIMLSRNFGQHPATAAGFLHSSGDWVVSLDEDMQHHPKYISKLLYSCASKSSDICYANSIDAIHNSFIRDKLSLVFKKSIGFLTGNKNVRYFNSYRVIRGPIARAASAVCRHETYLDVALSWFTRRINFETISLVDQRYQESQNSGYSIFSLFKHAKRMIMSSKFKFLRSGIFIGIVSFLISIVLGFYSLMARIFHFELIEIRGWSSLVISILFFGGLISLMVGLLLESVSDILISINGKPTFYAIDRSMDEELKIELETIFSDEDL